MQNWAFGCTWLDDASTVKRLASGSGKGNITWYDNYHTIRTALELHEYFSVHFFGQGSNCVIRVYGNQTQTCFFGLHYLHADTRRSSPIKWCQAFELDGSGLLSGATWSGCGPAQSWWPDTIGLLHINCSGRHHQAICKTSKVSRALFFSGQYTWLSAAPWHGVLPLTSHIQCNQ